MGRSLCHNPVGYAVAAIEGNQGTLCPKYVGENAVMAKATAQIAFGTETKAATHETTPCLSRPRGGAGRHDRPQGRPVPPRHPGLTAPQMGGYGVARSEMPRMSGDNKRKGKTEWLILKPEAPGPAFPEEEKYASARLDELPLSHEH